MRKRKNFKVDLGYMTCPDATRLFLDIVGKQESDFKEFYSVFLEGAKRGQFGGKEYKTNMYQVWKAKVVQFANEFKSNQSEPMEPKQLALFDIDEVEEKNDVDLKTDEIFSVIRLEEQKILGKDAAYDAIKKIISINNSPHL